MIETFSKHYLLELWECENNLLDDIKYIERTMVEAALECGAEIREVVFHKFSPVGISGVVLISESHLTIHIWPVEKYAAIDVFTCGDKIDPMIACDFLKEKLNSKKNYIKKFNRGNDEILEELT